jgi:hypothetical protein
MAIYGNGRVDVTTSNLANKISKLLGRVGVIVSADTLVANAAQFATISSSLYGPALLDVIAQTMAILPASNAGGVYIGNYGTLGPLFVPPSPGALAVDSITGRQWQFANNFWS